MTTQCDFETTLSMCLEALSAKPAALFTDIDGTISAMAQRPHEATISSAADAALDALSNSIALVALVTGRSIESAGSMTSLPSIAIIGNHGFEGRFDGTREIHPDADWAPEEINRAMATIEQILEKDGGLEGYVFENKQLSGSVHYRLAADTELAERRVMRAAQQASREGRLRLTQGKFVIEIRPDLDINKGTAISAAVSRFDLHGAVFLGDDTTDVDGFLALRAARNEGLATASVAVVSPDSNPLVAREADCCVEGVGGSIHLLEQIDRSLR